MFDFLLLLFGVVASCGIVLLAIFLCLVEPKPPFSRWYEQ